MIQPGWRRVDPRRDVLTATLEAWLAGHRSVALPATIVSGLLFAATAALVAFVGRKGK